ncbi:MAG: hypothetical protein K5651_04095 [Bacteroidales bacterium]|nr:hypothetical protein [Bacteroidales bacterium]
MKGRLENGVRYALWPDDTYKECFSISLIQKDSICFQEKFNPARKSFAADSVIYRAFVQTRDAITAHPEQLGSDNTIILVVGDFQKDDILARLQHLSVVMPHHQSSWERARRPIWEDKAPALTAQKTRSGHSLLRYSLFVPAIPESLGKTIVPTVSERSWSILQQIAERRLEIALEQGNIACEGIRSHYKAARKAENSDLFTLEVIVGEKDLASTAAHLCRVLKDIRDGQVSENELEAASNKYLFSRFDRQLRPTTHQAMGLLLFNSYLYASDLAPQKEKTMFFTSKKYKVKEDKSRFDRFAAHMIRIPQSWISEDTEHGHTIDSVASAGGPSLNFKDTSAFAGATRACKLSRKIAEGTTDGTMLFFENGTLAVYKQKECGKRIYFSYIFDGGYARLIHPEGAAWIEDVFWAGRVNGYKMKDFVSLLAAGGIDIHFNASHSALVLSGSCPERKGSSLLKALIALTGHFRVEDADLEYLARCADIPYYKDEEERIRLEISRMLHPEYSWDLDKSVAAATPKALQEVADLLRSSFRSSQKGTLFLQANIAERRVVSKLRRFMGQFPTDGQRARRIYSTLRTVSGTTRVGDIGPQKAMRITSSFNYESGLDRQLTKEIALALVQDRLRERLSDIGVRCRIEEHVIFQPVENVELSILLSGSPMQALRIINNNLREMGDGNISEDAFHRAAAELYARIQAQENSPFYWRDIIFNRLVYGKDFRNQIKARLDKVSPEDVSRFCEQWAQAGRVEYVLD